MPKSIFEEIVPKVEGEYYKRTPTSLKLCERAKRCMPGGDTRAVCYFKPYPIYIEKAHGAHLTDVDGNVYLDYVNNYTALVHGHTYAPVVEAVSRQIANGSVWAAYSEPQIRLADIICERVPSVDKIRFCNSGSEATMGAVWAARAFTGKKKIVKMEGGYHGSADMFEVSVHPSIAEAGPADKPNSVPARGVLSDTASQTLVVPFNSKEATQRVIEAHKDDIAALIVEPVMSSGGMVPGTQDYLKFLREITQQYGILLIFDEVVTLRLTTGGAQKFFGVMPDLTAMAKMIGGGFPVGAFGGREDIMQMFAPGAVDGLSHSGTFNGNPITMLAGAAAMEGYTAQAVEHVNRLGEALRSGLRDVLEEIGVNAQISGMGSLLQMHFSPKPVHDYRSSGSALHAAGTPSGNIQQLVFLGLLNRGIFCAKRGMFNTSTVMQEDDIERAVAAFRDAMEDVLPYIREAAPELLD